MVALRSVLFQVYFALVSVVLNVGWRPALLGPRSWSVKGIELWSQAVLWGLRVICGLRFEVRGREHIPAGPCIVAGKHQAMWDTVAIPVIVRDPALVLKRELLYVPFYGWYARKAKMIALDRGARRFAGQLGRYRLFLGGDAGRLIVVAHAFTRIRGSRRP